MPRTPQYCFFTLLSLQWMPYLSFFFFLNNPPPPEISPFSPPAPLPIYAGRRNNHASPPQVSALTQEPVDSCHANVKDRLDAVPHRLRGHQRFFGHRDVRGACRDHQHDAFSADFLVATDGDRAGKGMKFRPAVQSPDAFEQRLVAPSNQDVVFPPEHAPHNPFDLLGRLAAREDYFRKSLSKRPVVIDFGVAQVLVGEGAEPVHGLLDAEPSAPDLAQHFRDFFRSQFVLRPILGLTRPNPPAQWPIES